jgi:Chondroitinase B
MPRFENRRGDRIDLDRTVNTEVVLENCRDCTIEGVTFTHNVRAEDMLTLKDCVECKIINCTFKGKDTKGNFIHVKGEDSKRNLIERCTFKDHTFDGGNGGEAIIVGGGQFSGCRFETKIRKCEFINCKGDDEIVSIKSCNNVFENNEIKDNCEGNITIRHGGFNQILNNKFIGSGFGIRVLGDGNDIKGNYHKNNNYDGEDDRRPLYIDNGDRENDGHFRDGEPSDEEGDSSYDGYARAKNNTIEGNVYENCEGICVVWGRTNKDEKPRRNTFRNNILKADQKDSEFLKFDNGADRDENRFEGNKMFGEHADRGDLRDREVEHLEHPPEIREPDAGP